MNSMKTRAETLAESIVWGRQGEPLTEKPRADWLV